MAETKALTLTDFLMARIAEDEAEAVASLETGYQPPSWGPEDKPEFVPDFYDPPTDDDKARVARVRVECEAKRRIVELHWDCAGVCGECGVTSAAADTFAHEVAWPCPTLRALAAVYADHPDYCEEWRS